MPVPNQFANVTTSIPLSQLDANFNTPITLGNTAIQLGNTVTTLNNMTFANVTITSVSTPITAAQGGTGLSTLASNNVLLGNGTGTVQVVAPGSAGNVLTSTGTTWTSNAASSLAVTSFSAGTTGFTPNSATQGAVTLAGTLATTNGGTGLTSFTANGVVYASSTSALATGSAFTFDGSSAVISVNSATDALRITQTGAGNALVVEDSANPDATPFVVTATGSVGIGTTTPATALDVRGDICAGPDTVGRAVLSKGSATDSGFVSLWNADLSVRQGYFGFATLAGNGVMDVWSQTTGNAIRFGTNNLERMRITGAGIVGIGTSTPQTGTLLTVAGTSTFGRDGTNGFTQLVTGTSGNTGYIGFFTAADVRQAYIGYIGSPNDALNIETDSGSNKPIRFATNAATRVQIDISGFTQFSSNLVMPYQGAPTSKSGAATLSGAELITGILNTTGTTYTITLPTGANIEGALTWSANNVCLDWWVINTASGTITIGANGNTTLGTLTVATGVSAHFRIRRTAANTFTVYRLG